MPFEIAVLVPFDLVVFPTSGAFDTLGLSLRSTTFVLGVLPGQDMLRIRPVARHKDDMFFTSLTEVPQRIVDKQHVKGIDAVSGSRNSAGTSSVETSTVARSVQPMSSSSACAA